MQLVEALSRRSGVSATKILRIAATASSRYKVYKVAKRNGGLRTIEHPSKELKAIQRWLVSSVLSSLPVHPSATAYKKGSSILSNAQAHVRSNFTVRLDFKNFFPSFESSRIAAFIYDKALFKEQFLSVEDANFCTSIFCRKEHLTIGAPSSPALTNAMMFGFDNRLSDHCLSNGMTYTRYADDIFVSAAEPVDVGSIINYISEFCNIDEYINISLNLEKTAVLSRRRKRVIAGLVITSDRLISIGRERKRLIHSMVHRFLIGNLPPEKVSELHGLIGFVGDVEPSFLVALEKKYGAETIAKVRRY